ncbi:MAG: hypothetical protein FWC73_10790 [Defluviitaleaceae bacterium]|nr:hypothetical protein [Defluviitaleaceae bacterium]
MKNWRRILVTGMVAGMIAFTGCSSNIPETNQGNRNGQRVVDAVNRRTDTYTTTRSSAARRAHRPTRSARHYSRGLRTRNTAATRHNTATRHHSRNIDGVTRHVPNHSTTHNRGRVGHTFGYQPMAPAHSFDEFGGYDLGMRAGTHSNNYIAPGAHNTVNNRVVRNTPVPRATTPTRSTTRATRTATAVAPKSTATAPKAVTPTRKATTVTPTRKATTATHKAATPTPKATTTTRKATTAPRTHVAPKVAATSPKPAVNRNTTPVRDYRRTTPVRSTRNTPTHSNRQVRRANATRNDVNHRNDIIGLDNINMNHNPVVTPLVHNSENPTRSTPRTRRNSNVVRNTRNEARVSRNHVNTGIHYTNDANVTRMDNVINGNEIYSQDNTFRNIQDRSFANNDALADRINPAVYASASEEGDYAFFKRNKTNTDETPAIPEPTDAPTRSNRITPNLQPEPAITPAPVQPSSMNEAISDTDDYNNIHDINEDTANDPTDNNGYDYGNQLKPLPKEDPTKTTPTRRVGQRAMK